MNKKQIYTICFAALVVLVAWAPDVLAYNNYGGGCQNCHGGFLQGGYISNTAQDGVAWNTSLHSGHQSFADCTACHQQIGDNPVIGGPSGDGLGGCVGCHGRAEDANIVVSMGSGIGAGLRQHHWGNGIDCSGCHADSNPNAFTPVGEDVPGLHNAILGVDPCNDSVFGQFGSDNDGDNLYDGNDPDCASEPVCGDGILDTGEQCDDGNTIDGDGCQADCQLPICGDSIVDIGEQCDDGNNVNSDGCQADCQLPVCGDGIQDAGESCDDGNSTNGDGCENDCTLTPPGPFCGDGNVDPGEECDDGNTTNGDGCENDCTLTPPGPFCGDGNVDPGEACDDGNTTNGDGCENDCTITLPVGCSDADLPTITEMEYNRRDEKLHFHGTATPGTSLRIINSDSSVLLTEILVREGEWEAEINDVGTSLESISVISSNGCAINLDISTGDDGRSDDDEDDDDEEHRTEHRERSWER